MDPHHLLVATSVKDGAPCICMLCLHFQSRSRSVLGQVPTLRMGIMPYRPGSPLSSSIGAKKHRHERLGLQLNQNPGDTVS